jgi:DNA-directed RNA polymerase sigma subunit (sigma70/sigma32)
MSVAQIERCEKAFALQMCSLDQNMVNRKRTSQLDDGQDTLSSIITSKTDDVEYDEVELYNLREDLLRAVNSHLTEEEAAILILKFGMDNEYASSKKIGRSIAEVARKVGLKPDKVRRIIKRSLTQLQTVVGDDFRTYNRDFCI